MDLLKLFDIGKPSQILNELDLDEINCGVSQGSIEKIDLKTSHLIESINPSKGLLIAKVKCATEASYEAVLKNATDTFECWRNLPAPKRGELVRRIAEELRNNKDSLGSLIALEMGKSKQEGDGEVQEMIDIADFAVGLSRQLYGLSMHSERPEHRMYEQWQPLGVVGVISAFNFPMAVWAWNAFIAAICGNTCVWKPSSKTPLCAIAVQKICNEVMEDINCPGVFSLFITDERELSESFVNDKRVRLMSFTGSTTVGRHVGELVAKRLGRSLLELGGNNAIIVDETANCHLAIPAVMFGAIGTAGQRCTSTRRLFLHEDVYDEFVSALSNAYRQITIGDALDPKNIMGPLIDESAVNNFCAAIETIKADGGTIIAGGNTIDRKGFYVEPTLVTDISNDHPLVQAETFAPILYIIKYSDLDQAIAEHNAVPQGLSSAIFTQNVQHAEIFLSARGSDCGIANVNIGTSGAEIGGAFGGEKDTGGGREAGSDAWKAYMRRQTTTINWSDELPLAQGIKFDIDLK